MQRIRFAVDFEYGGTDFLFFGKGAGFVCLKDVPGRNSHAESATYPATRGFGILSLGFRDKICTEKRFG